MAEVVSEYIDAETGKSIIEYDNGARKDAVTGYWLNGPSASLITSDNAREMLAKRYEAQRRKLAAEIERRRGQPADVAVAYAMGEVFDDAIASDGRIKDRFDVIVGVGKHLGVIADQRETTLDNVSDANKASAETLRMIVGALMEARSASRSS